MLISRDVMIPSTHDAIRFMILISQNDFLNSFLTKWDLRQIINEKVSFYYFSNKILQNFSIEITKLHVCLCFQLSVLFL